MCYLDNMNDELGGKCSAEGTSAKALKQEEACRHFRKRTRQIWPSSSEEEVGSLEM